jgi:hypothetical protein
MLWRKYRGGWRKNKCSAIQLEGDKGSAHLTSRAVARVGKKRRFRSLFIEDTKKTRRADERRATH